MLAVVWRSGRVVEGSGLENRSTKVPGVRIPPPPLHRQRLDAIIDWLIDNEIVE